FPADGELIFWEAVVHRERNDPASASAALERLLRLPRPESWANMDEGLHSYRARHLLAETYLLQGRTAEAEAQCPPAVEECPEFTPAWQELARVWVSQGRWAELARALPVLEADAATAAEATVLRGRLSLSRRDFAAARAHLSQAIAAHPQLLPLRILL